MLLMILFSEKLVFLILVIYAKHLGGVIGLYILIDLELMLYL